MDLSNKNIEKMLATRFFEDLLKRGGYYIVNNNANSHQQQQQQQQQRCQYQKPPAIPNPHHHQHHHQRRYGHVIANEPLAMNNGSRVIYKNRAGPMHGGVKEIKKNSEHGGIDLRLLKEEENVPEGIDLSLKLWFE